MKKSHTDSKNEMAEEDTSNIAGDTAPVLSSVNSPSPALNVALPLATIEQRAASPTYSLKRPRSQTTVGMDPQLERSEGHIPANPGISHLVSTAVDENTQYEKPISVGKRYAEHRFAENELHLCRSRSRERPDKHSRSRSRSPKQCYTHRALRHDLHMAREAQEELQNPFFHGQDAHYNTTHDNDSRYSIVDFAHCYDLPQQHPGSRKHKRWCPIYVHTAKCDKCLRHNVDILQRCVDGCNMQFCRFCLQVIVGRDNKHIVPEGGFDWTPKLKGAAKRRRTQDDVAAAASYSSGAALQADPLLAPFFHSNTRVISINSANPTVIPSERIRSENARARTGGVTKKSYSLDRYQRHPYLPPSDANDRSTNDIEHTDINDNTNIVLEDRNREIYIQDTEPDRYNRVISGTDYPPPLQAGTSSAPEFGARIKLPQGQYNPRSSLDETYPPSLNEVQTFEDAVILLEDMRSRPRISDEEEQHFQYMRMASWHEDANLQKIKEEEGTEEAERVFQAVTLVMRLRLGLYGMR